MTDAPDGMATLLVGKSETGTGNNAGNGAALRRCASLISDGAGWS